MLRVSLRQLLLLVAILAIAMVSLKNASPTWHVAIGLLAMITVLIAVLVAILDRGPRQVFAIGCAIAMLGYGLLVASETKVGKGPGGTLVNFQLDFSNGGELQQLPTTALLRYAHAAIQTTHWIDRSTNKEVSGYNMSMYQAAMATGSIPNIAPQVWPFTDSFTQIGHYWWGLLFGFIGGQIAQFVDRRRAKELAAAGIPPK